jgi:carboxypeptidase family protein/TonB-dependent receptor-like protein
MPTSNLKRVAVALCSLACIALVLALSLPPKAEAQVLYGSIVGNVKDPSGAAVPRATITLTNKATNLTREAVTDESGGYSLTDLPTGTYTLKISQPGFKTFEQTEVTVSLNSVNRVDITLQVGEVSETVTITGEAAILQTETSEVHADLVATELENLPVPLGRNYQQIFKALPGFSPPVNSHSIPTNPARSLEFNVNGTSDNQNNTRVDGVSTYNVLLPHVVSYIPTLESLQEVNIVTNSFDAEQGLAGGAAINLQTKTGTNQMHGSLFEYHSDNHLKAWPDQIDDPELNVGNKPKLVYNQFGGTAGGAIKKDKLFYFVSYEGTYDHRAVERRVTVPSAAMKKGDFSASDTPIYDPFTGNPDGTGRTQFSVAPGDPNYALCDTATNPQCLNILPAARMDSIATKLAGMIPDPNLGGTRNNYYVAAPFAFNRHQVDTKINYNATPKLNLTGTFGVLRYSTSVPTVFGDELVGRPIGGSSNPGHGSGETYRFTVMGNYTFSPNVVLDAHFGWARQGTASEQPGLGTNIGSDVLGIPGTNGPRTFESGWPEFEFKGADDYATLGVDNNFMPYYRHDPQYQYVANLSWVKGKHNLRFGTDLYHMGLNEAQAEFLGNAYGAQGGFNFDRGPTLRCEEGASGGGCNQTSDSSRSNSFASFMLGLPTVNSRTLQVPDEYHVGVWLISTYARDRWNITPKLTLDYGVRWEYFPVASRPDRGIEYYDASINKVLLCGFGEVPKNCGIEVSKKLFAPRVGLAYRATDSTVIRAGYGLTNDPYEGLEFVRANHPVLLALYNQTPNSLFPVSKLSDGIPPVAAPDEGNGVIDIPTNVGFSGYPKKFQRGYIQSWNLTVQKELPMGFTGQVGYVATRSTRQLAMLDTNAGQVIGAGAPGRPLYGPYGRVAATGELRPIGTGVYDSLQAQLQRRFSGGLALTVNYTWGKAINFVNGSDTILGDNSKIQALQYLYLNRARTDFDRTHNFAVTNVWQLPFGRGKHWLNSGGAASAILGGWQVNTILSLISGPPFTVTADDTSLNLPGSSQHGDQVGPVRKLGGIGASSPFYDQSSFAEVNEPRFGTSGFNILNAPGIVNWDFGLFREFSLSERFKLQFRMESFNFTNTPHFAKPEGSVSNGSDFMTITSIDNDPNAREGIDERQFRFGLRISF